MTPGFSDMHTHILYDEALDLYIANGVTLVRNMHGDPVHLNMRKNIRDGKRVGPELYTTGPMVDGEKPYMSWIKLNRQSGK